MLDVFDFAEPAFVSGDRDETSVPTQALFMMNSAAVTDAATTMARRVLAERSKDFERIDRAFALAVGRKPTQAEAAKMRELVVKADKPMDKRQAYADICWVLLNTSEFALNH
jgi:hypothetical protein